MTGHTPQSKVVFVSRLSTRQYKPNRYSQEVLSEWTSRLFACNSQARSFHLLRSLRNDLAGSKFLNVYIVFDFACVYSYIRSSHSDRRTQKSANHSRPRSFSTWQRICSAKVKRTNEYLRIERGRVCAIDRVLQLRMIAAVRAFVSAPNPIAVPISSPIVCSGRVATMRSSPQWASVSWILSYQPRPEIKEIHATTRPTRARSFEPRWKTRLQQTRPVLQSNPSSWAMIRQCSGGPAIGFTRLYIRFVRKCNRFDAIIMRLLALNP
jgi:hypothetical protein